MMPELKKEITAESVRNLEPGETLSLVEYLDTGLTIADVMRDARGMKEAARVRFKKTVTRAAEATGQRYALGTQLVWNDRYGMSLLTTITCTVPATCP